MSNIEVNKNIRNRVLLFLYDKYSQGDYHPQVTEKVLSQIGITKDFVEIAHRNINHLENAGYIHGETPLGSPCAKWIKIEPLGIDFVERLQSNYANIHSKIRFEILANLYQQYFSGENQGRLAVNALVKSLASVESNENLIIGDVIYLRKNNIISGEYTFGSSYPPWISIDTLGIQILEDIMNESLVRVANTELYSQNKNELDAIIREFDKETKFHKFYNWFKQNTSIVEFVINVAKSIFTGG